MRISRIILALLGVIFLIIIIVLLFGGGPEKPRTTLGVVLKPLPDYADTNSEVSLTNDGIVNGDDIHRSIRITVSNDTRILDIIQGYSDTVIDKHTFSNTPDAYSVFLKAINTYGFLSKNAKARVPANPDGQCPLGFRYIYKLSQDGGDIFTAWSSSCNTGNSSGVSFNLLTLFQNQITDYNKLVQKVNLSATAAPTQTGL